MTLSLSLSLPQISININLLSPPPKQTDELCDALEPLITERYQIDQSIAELVSIVVCALLMC